MPTTNALNANLQAHLNTHTLLYHHPEVTTADSSCPHENPQQAKLQKCWASLLLEKKGAFYKVVYKIQHQKSRRQPKGEVISDRQDCSALFTSNNFFFSEPFAATLPPAGSWLDVLENNSWGVWFVPVKNKKTNLQQGKQMKKLRVALHGQGHLPGVIGRALWTLSPLTRWLSRLKRQLLSQYQQSLPPVTLEPIVWEA